MDPTVIQYLKRDRFEKCYILQTLDCLNKLKSRVDAWLCLGLEASHVMPGSYSTLVGKEK